MGQRHIVERDRQGARLLGALSVSRVRLGLEQLDLLEGGHAFGGSMELRPDPAQRPVGLGCQEQHHQRGREVHPAGLEPQPDLDRHEGDRQRGHQLQGDRRGEGDLERRHGHLAVTVGDPADRAPLGLGATVGDQGGQPLHHIEEVTGQLRQDLPLPIGRIPGRHPDQGGEDRDQGEGEHDNHRRDPVLDCDRHHGQEGQDAREQQRREIAGDIRLDRRSPAGAQRGRFPKHPPRSPGGPQPEYGREHLIADVDADDGGGAGRGEVAEPDHERPDHHEEEQDRRRPAQRTDRAPLPRRDR